MWSRIMNQDSGVLADLCFCSCLSLIASSRRGLGMKVMSAPSFTSRPIHQSLLYFCEVQYNSPVSNKPVWVKCEASLSFIHSLLWCAGSLWHRSWLQLLGRGSPHPELHSNSHWSLLQTLQVWTEEKTQSLSSCFQKSLSQMKVSAICF